MADPKAKVILTAEDKTKRAFRSANDGLKGLKKEAKSVTNAFAAIGGAFIAFQGLSKLTGNFQSLNDEIDRLAKSAAALGLTVGELDALNFAAARFGVTSEQLAVGLRQFNKNLNDLKFGTGEAKIAFQQLRISFLQLEGKTLAEQLALVADGFTNIFDEGTQAAIAMRLFGESGAQLAPLLRQGAEGMEELLEQAEKLGLINEELAESADKLKESQLKLNRAWRTLQLTILPSLNEQLTTLLNSMVGMDDVIIRDIPFWESVWVGLSGTWQEAEVRMGELADTVADTAVEITKLNNALIQSNAQLADLPDFPFEDPLLLGQFVDLMEQLNTEFEQSHVQLGEINTELLEERELIRGSTEELAIFHTTVLGVAGAVENTLGSAFSSVFAQARADATLFEQVMLSVLENLGNVLINSALAGLLSLLPGGNFLAAGFSIFGGGFNTQGGQSSDRQFRRNAQTGNRFLGAPGP